MSTAAATAAANREWLEVWTLPLSTILIAFVSGFFGPQWLNRRNARATSVAQAKKDEATAAQVVEQASVSLIKHFRDIVDESERQIAAYEEEIKRMQGAVTAAEMAASSAARRAAAAETHSVQAERRARDIERNLEDAREQIVILHEQVASLEARLHQAGIPLEG